MYDQYFHFKESPFSVTPDPQFFYTNPVYREAYASLTYGITTRKGFIVITGEVGTGKTTLLRKLLHDLDRTVRFACVFNTRITFDDLLWAALRDLGVSTTRNDKPAMLDDLNTYLIDQFKNGHCVCLLIDEAQNLADEALEELRLLSNLETDKQKLLQIVLVGQPELNAKLDKPSLRQLKQRVAIQCKILPLEEGEVGSYIAFRLELAGYPGRVLFEPEAVQKIALYSRGIPRLINILCDNALLTAFAVSKEQVSADMIKEVADDLRLAPDTRPAGGKDNRSSLARPDTKRGLIAAAGIILGVLLGALGMITLFFVIDLRSFFADDRARKIVATAKPEGSIAPRQESTRASTDQKSESVKVENPGGRVKQWRDQVAIPYGSTVYEIALDVYGENAALGLDLIREFNRQIPNLNRVAAGQELILPALTPETLVRRQPDDSYRLIIAAFFGRSEAEALAGRLRQTGYRAAIGPRRVSNDIVVYRVEVDGLKTIEESTQILRSRVTDSASSSVRGQEGGPDTR